MNKLLFGSDPEVFVTKNGYCIPPIHLIINNEIGEIGKTPDKGRPIFYKDDVIKIIEDGSAMEFNTKPTDDPYEYYDIIQHGLDVLRKLVPQSYDITVLPAVKFNLARIVFDNQLFPLYEYSCRFGCDPDLDIYSGKYSRTVDAKRIKNRFGGGHLHISGMDLDNMDITTLVELFDIFIGNTFVLQSPYPEYEKIRQQYYGRPGKIRIQHYPNNITGIEYRTLSNSWITNLDSIKLMFEAATAAIDNYPNAQDIINKFLEISIKNILTFNKENAKEILCQLMP